MLKVIIAVFLPGTITAVLFSPEVVAAGLTFLNTVLLVAHSRHVRRTLEPKVNRVAAQVATVVNEVTPGWDHIERRGDGDE